MIRIASVSLNSSKQIRFALTPIKGIGKSNVVTILKNLNIDPKSCLDDLSEQELVELRNHVETNYMVEADLRRKTQSDIKRLVDLNSWRGLRHKSGLPVRGQTTRTNSRTVRGNSRKTGSSGRAKSAAKT